MTAGGEEADVETEDDTRAGEEGRVGNGGSEPLTDAAPMFAPMLLLLLLPASSSCIRAKARLMQPLYSCVLGSNCKNDLENQPKKKTRTERP